MINAKAVAPLRKDTALTGLLLLLTLASPFAVAAELTLYTTREAALIQPLLDVYTKQSGVKVNTVFVKDGLLERVKAEGERSPADVLMTVDIGNLIDLVDGGVTQATQSKVLESAIPANLRDASGHWYALSLRARVVLAEKGLALDSLRYEDLAKAQYKGKVCIRSGQHPYNTSLVAAMIAHDGAAATEQWLQGVKNNLGRKPAGGDRDVARDILGGICDVGIANAYYVGQMRNAAAGSNERKWGDAIKVIRPTFANTSNHGTHVNVSGAAVARHAPNKAEAVKLLEYLVSEPAQTMYAQVNYEYPVRAGVALDSVVASFGPLVPDSLPVADIAKYRKEASKLIDKVGFDN